MTVTLIGHSQWEMHAEPSHVTLPRGTSVTFYSESFPLLLSDQAGAVTTLSEVFADAEENQRLGEFASAPNYALSPLENDLHAFLTGRLQPDLDAVFVTEEVRLCAGDGSTCGDGFHDCTGLLADPRVVGEDVSWIACEPVALPEPTVDAGPGAAAEGGPEDSPPESPDAFYAFLAAHGPRWDGQEESWAAFSEWFVYQGGMDGVPVGAQGFVDLVAAGDDKRAVFAQYGVEIVDPAHAGPAEPDQAPQDGFDEGDLAALFAEEDVQEVVSILASDSATAGLTDEQIAALINELVAEDEADEDDDGLGGGDLAALFGEEESEQIAAELAGLDETELAALAEEVAAILAAENAASG